MGLHGDMYMVLAQRHFADVFCRYLHTCLIFYFCLSNDFIVKITQLSGAMILFKFSVAPTTTSLLLSVTFELFELDSGGGAQIEALLTQIKEFILSEVQKFRN